MFFDSSGKINFPLKLNCKLAPWKKYCSEWKTGKSDMVIGWSVISHIFQATGQQAQQNVVQRSDLPERGEQHKHFSSGKINFLNWHEEIKNFYRRKTLLITLKVVEDVGWEIRFGSLAFSIFFSLTWYAPNLDLGSLELKSSRMNANIFRKGIIISARFGKPWR